MELSPRDVRADERRGWQASWWAVIVSAVVAATLVRLVAQVAEVDVAVGSGSSERVIGLVDVMFGSAVPALCGAITLHLMLRWFERGLSWWTIGASVSLVLSLLSPLQAVSVQAWAVLTLLHLTTGLVVIAGLRAVSTVEAARAPQPIRSA